MLTTYCNQRIRHPAAQQRQGQHYHKTVLLSGRSTAIVRKCILISAILTGMQKSIKLSQRFKRSYREQKIPCFASHIIGIAVKVENGAGKIFSPFAYNEALDHKRACMNCEALLTLGQRRPYNCFPHPGQTDDKIAWAQSRPE